MSAVFTNGGVTGVRIEASRRVANDAVDGGPMKIMTGCYHVEVSRRRDEYEPEKRVDVLAALWETSGDEIEEWFRVPWRDGRVAIQLCITVAADLPRGPDSERATAWLSGLFQRRRELMTSADYQLAEDLAGELRRSAASADVFLSAGLAIAANWIAHSDGGGHAPNSYLMGAFWPLLRDGRLEETAAAEWVGRARATDLGLDWTASRDPDHLFRWLWLNRRYRLAFLAVTR